MTQNEKQRILQKFVTNKKVLGILYDMMFKMREDEIDHAVSALSMSLGTFSNNKPLKTNNTVKLSNIERETLLNHTQQ